MNAVPQTTTHWERLLPFLAVPGLRAVDLLAALSISHSTSAISLVILCVRV